MIALFAFRPARMLSLGLALCLGLSTVAPSVAAKEWTRVRIGVDTSYPPFESKLADGSIVGFDVDLGNALCKQAKLECVWVETDFDSLIPALKARKFDAIISTLAVTPQRKRQVAFSDKLFGAPARMIARTGSPLQPSAAALKGRRVGVQQGTTSDAYAREKWAPHGVEVISYVAQDQVYSDLIAGRLDASLQDLAQGDFGFLKTSRGAGFAWAGPTLNDPKTLGEGLAIGMRLEDTELRSRFNQAIAALHADGSYERLQSKYFDFDLYGS